jgi:hypothetical protein
MGLSGGAKLRGPSALALARTAEGGCAHIFEIAKCRISRRRIGWHEEIL